MENLDHLFVVVASTEDLERLPLVDWVEAYAGKLTGVFGTHEENMALIESERRSWGE